MSPERVKAPPAPDADASVVTAVSPFPTPAALVAVPGESDGAAASPTAPLADLSQALGLLDDGVAVLAVIGSTARVLSASGPLAGLLGVAAEALPGIDLLELAAPEAVPALEAALTRAASSEEALEVTTLLRRESATWLATLRLQRVHPWSGSGVQVLCMISDRTAEIAQQERLGRALHLDPVTQGPNRSWVDVEGARLVSEARPFGLLVVGFEGLAEINASHGRWCGDQLLAVARTRALEVAGPPAMVGRYVGNELVIAVQGDESGLRSRTHMLAEQLEVALSRPVDLQGQDFELAATAGTAVHPIDARDLPDLLDVATVQLWDVRRHRRTALTRLAWRASWALHHRR